jgi:hypothetical protein
MIDMAIKEKKPVHNSLVLGQLASTTLQSAKQYNKRMEVFSCIFFFLFALFFFFIFCLFFVCLFVCLFCVFVLLCVLLNV